MFKNKSFETSTKYILSLIQYYCIYYLYFILNLRSTQNVQFIGKIITIKAFPTKAYLNPNGFLNKKSF